MDAIEWSENRAYFPARDDFARLPFDPDVVGPMRFETAPAVVLGSLAGIPEVELAWVKAGGKRVPVVIEAGSQPPQTSSLPPGSIEAMAEMQPASDFRQELHRALEASHRQQHAQRVLGTHAPIDWRETEQAQEAQARAWSAALFMMLLSFFWFILGRRAK